MQRLKEHISLLLITSTFLTFFLTLVVGVFFYVENLQLYWFLVAFAIVCFVFPFFITQYRVEKFIYRRVKKIYDDVRLLDASTFNKKQITTDMEPYQRSGTFC